VIDPEARAPIHSDSAWRDLRRKLRWFVQRRIRRPSDVEDVVQDILVRIQRGLPSLREHQRFGPWVYRVARNAIVDHVRAVGRDPVAELGDSERVTDAAHDVESDPPEDSADCELAACAARLVSTLPSPYRDALVLTELEQRTSKEAAERLGLSVSGVKSRVQRGRRRLRATLEACCDIDLDARRRPVGCEPKREDDCGSPPSGV